MTNKSRYFLAGSGVVLLAGLGAGTWAYLAYHRNAGVPAGLPAELRYVPADAQMVAFADVKSVMGSAMRRELERMTTGRRGQQQMHEFAGIDLEKDVNKVLAFMQNDSGPGDATQGPPRILLLAQGNFNQPQVEQFMKEHGGVIEDYHGKHLVVRPQEPPPPQAPMPPAPPPAPARPSDEKGALPDKPSPDVPDIRPQMPQMRRGAPEMAIGFVRPDLIAVGATDLVRRALDDSGRLPNITTNSELMSLMGEESTANAWVVGQFDAVSRRIGLPPAVRTQVPPLRLVSASAHIDGGVKATVRARTTDEAAGDQLRSVVRGAITVARMQTNSNPDLQNAMKTVELGGTGNNVQLSFMMTPDTLRAITPGPPGPRPPAPPPVPEPPSPQK